jgi:hypothetical protein
MRHCIGSWVLFIVLGTAMGFLRYGGILPPQHFQMLTEYGPYVVLFVHAVVVLIAFKDGIFQGILCLLIPMYSFYYLFMVTDQFYFRAIVAGLLVGIGIDSAVFFQGKFLQLAEEVRRWIASGG